MEEATHAVLRDLPPLVVIDLHGEMTALAAKPVMDAYHRASAQGARNLLLNFSHVDHVNSGGFAIVIGILTEARQAQQRILLTGLTQHYAKIVKVMGLQAFAPMFDTEEDARASVAGE